MKHFLLTILLLCCASTLMAQNILEEIRRDEPGKGKITITQSAEIEDLIREVPKEAEKKQETKPATPANETKSSTPAKDEAHKPIATTTTPKTTDEEPSTKKVARPTYKTTGYRIQVYSGGNTRSDREKCEQIAARLRSSFPNMTVYVHFYSPSWKCRAGNFTSHEEASRMLQQVRKMGYSQACLVKGTINVAY